MSDNESKYRRTIVCPHCEGELSVHFDVTVQSVAKRGDESDGVDAWRATLRKDEIEFLARSQANGILAAFEEVACVAKKEQPPRNIERFFLNFLRTASLKQVPEFALKFYRDEFSNGFITVIGSQGILAILANKELKCFALAEGVIGKNLRTVAGRSTGIKSAPTPKLLEEWKRSRFGYVIRASVFESELKAISVGSFAKPRIEIKNR